MKRHIKITFKILLSLLILSCSDDDKENTSSSTESSNKIFFISGEIDGVPFRHESNLDASESDFLFGGNTQNFFSTETETCRYTYKTGFDANINQSLPSGEFIFSNLLENDTCDPSIELETFKNNFFIVDSYTFGNENSGLSFNYIPVTNNDKYFNTYSGNQSTNNFQITKSTLNEPNTFFNIFEFTKTIEGNFSCKLYNPNDNSEVLNLTKGKFRLVVHSDDKSAFFDLQD